MTPDKPDPESPTYMNFSGPQKTSRIIGERAKSTEYADVDLASGYPSSMIWTTKDGRKIAVPNLSDSHLVNIVGFLRARASKKKKQFALRMLLENLSDMMGIIYATMSDDTKQDMADANSAEVDRIFRMDDEDFLRRYFPIYPKLLEECYRRKLIVAAPLKAIEDETGEEPFYDDYDLYGKDSPR